MINILIAPNSFKECSDSTTISKIIYSSFQKYLPNKLKESISFTQIPISDGGDGFVNVCRSAFELDIISFKVSCPYDENTITCDIGYDKINSIVYIESASILGLKVVPKDKRKPLTLSSKGLGELLIQLNDTVEKKKLIIQKAVIGIGGTATNDFGLGACTKLGLELEDIDKNTLDASPDNFNKITSVKSPKHPLNFDLELIIDVDNPLLGDNGASKTYGEQKGLSKKEIDLVENGISNILSVLKIKKDNIDKLSGAGGGLAAGLQLFFNAKIKTAKDFIVNDLGINSEKYKFDIVITGEGKLDEQSLFSKGAMIVLNQFSYKDCSQIVICGSSTLKDYWKNKIYVIEISKFFNSIEESIKNYDKGIELAVKEIVNNYLSKV